MMTNTACTWYQRFVVSGEETWERSVIDAVFWENRKAANVVQSGLLEADSAYVYIPISEEILLIAVGDYLVKGKVTDEISASYTISDLKAEHKDVVRVNSVDTLDFGDPNMQHIKIGGS